jgi:hypothetical protein
VTVEYLSNCACGGRLDTGIGGGDPDNLTESSPYEGPGGESTEMWRTRECRGWVEKGIGGGTSDARAADPSGLDGGAEGGIAWMSGGWA